MKRLFVILLFLSACGSAEHNAPKDLDNACSILEQRPGYHRAFKRAEKKYGAPVHVQMAMMHQESKFIGDARTPLRYSLGVIPIGRQSSAFGYSQALDGTWKEYKEETGNKRAKRDRIKDATDFMGWYMTKTRAQNGIRMDDARNQYLAYHDGHTGYARGTYRSKAWLMRVARRVADRANLYEAQLKTCKRLR